MAPINDPAVVSDWIEYVWKAGGTDLLLTADAPPLARIDGAYGPIDKEAILTHAKVDEIAHKVIAADLMKSFDAMHQVDFSLTWRDSVRVRGNCYRQRGATAIALRIIPMEIPTLQDLGLPDVARTFAEAPSGLVLLTGPTGAGKSTTLASLIDHVNQIRPCHILTIEDPIEYVYSHKRAVISQREIGIDATRFSDALRAALREDPDVILVGEMRDLESISATLTLAETGHLVFATLHTNDTAQAIDRIVDVFPADRRDQIQVQLASTLLGVIYQRLIPRTEGGMVAAYEIMVGNNAVKNLVREGKARQLRNVVATHAEAGMQTLEASLSDLLAEGVITDEHALAVSLHPKEIKFPAPTPVEGEEVEEPRKRRLRK
jgi:twitching motility protein PilT